jgi:disulfide bond formation protein DsbB
LPTSAVGDDANLFEPTAETTGNESMSRKLPLIAIAVLSFAAVALALVGQHYFDMRPCPWCILQRVIYLAIGLAALLGLIRPLRMPAAALALVLAGCGIAAALYQHFVAAKSNSCALTLADRIVSALGLDRLAPSWFEATANCSEAIVKVFGIAFDVWSLLLYCVLAVAAILALRGR